jgi:uncharacterized protein YjbJ (UPF0337 family)
MEGAVDWDRMSANWAHWRGRVHERWSRLTDADLMAIAGNRDRLADRIRESYGLTPAEAQRQLTTWERNLAIEDFETVSPQVKGRR